MNLSGLCTSQVLHSTVPILGEGGQQQSEPSRVLLLSKRREKSYDLVSVMIFLYCPITGQGLFRAAHNLRSTTNQECLNLKMYYLTGVTVSLSLSTNAISTWFIS